MSQRRVVASILFIVALMIWPLSALAANRLVWDPPQSGEVKGYRIYYGTSAEALTAQMDVRNVTEYPISALPLKENTKYFFVVRAYNDSGESANSNIVDWTLGDATPPAPPGGVGAKVLESQPQ